MLAVKTTVIRHKWTHTQLLQRMPGGVVWISKEPLHRHIVLWNLVWLGRGTYVNNTSQMPRHIASWHLVWLGQGTFNQLGICQSRSGGRAKYPSPPPESTHGCIKSWCRTVHYSYPQPLVFIVRATRWIHVHKSRHFLESPQHKLRSISQLTFLLWCVRYSLPQTLVWSGNGLEQTGPATADYMGDIGSGRESYETK